MKLNDALTLLAEAEDRIRRAREMVQQEVPAEQGAWTGGLILAEILREGGSAKRERLHEIAAKYGMDNRGLGGFFTGKGSLHALPGVDLVMLTPEGAKTATRYLGRLEAAEPVAEPDFGRAAEASFAEDWDSDEDSIYDRA